MFVECGGTLAGSLLKDGLVDEIYQFVAPKILNDQTGISCFMGNSCKAINECVNLQIYETKKIGDDILLKAVVKNK